MPRFTNKVAIITGSSNGIGRSTAVILARDGAKVTITGRNAERLEETRQQIIGAGVRSENINAIVADLNTAEGQDQLINSTVQKFGHLDILVNNAGTAIMDGKLGLNQDISTFDKNFELNIRSIVELVKKARPHLEKTKGEIINVSTISSGEQGHFDFSYYSMAKAALDQFTRNIALELIPVGIRVNSVKPGIVSTGFIEAMGAPPSGSNKLFKFLGSNPHCIPAGRCGEPEDIANVIAFLADRAASFYIVGQVITVDGGTTLVLGIRTHDFMELMK